MPSINTEIISPANTDKAFASDSTEVVADSVSADSTAVDSAAVDSVA